jgi:hypothetical protein
MSTLWLIKLVLSHLLTDFVFQPAKWVTDRRARHFGSSFLYVHAFITGALALAFIGPAYWEYAVAILVTHLLIDGWKSYRPDKMVYFLADQGLHLLVIMACWFHAFSLWKELAQECRNAISNEHLWVYVTAFVFLSFPSGIVIGKMTRQWSDAIQGGDGLANAGKWIGILERTIILILILQNQYSLIGLLITAKGLLRFSEKDRAEEKTEYVLIGSLISVAFAIITGIIVNQLTSK